MTSQVANCPSEEHLIDATVLFSIDVNGVVEKVPTATFPSSSTSGKRGKIARAALTTAAKEAHPSSSPPAVREMVTNEQYGDASWQANSGDISLYAYFLSSAGVSRLSLCGILLLVAAIGERMPRQLLQSIYKLGTVWLTRRLEIFVRIWQDRDPESRSYFIWYALFGIANPVLHVVAIG